MMDGSLAEQLLAAARAGDLATAMRLMTTIEPAEMEADRAAHIGNVCAKYLATDGIGRMPVSESTEQLFEKSFTSAKKALDHLNTSSQKLGPSSDSANASGSHGVGALSQYNACREGIVFSNGALVAIDGVDGFEDDMAAFSAAVFDIAFRVLAGIERQLELPSGWFERELGPLAEHSQWHIKRYVPEAAAPAAVTDDGKHVLLPVHSDPSLISLVLHDAPGTKRGAMGLEYLLPPSPMRDGPVWEEVGSHGHGIVNVLCGSVLDRITGGHYRAVKHRVATRDPQGDAGNGKRVVATFFLRPAPSAMLVAPPSPKLPASARRAKPIKFEAWRKKVADKYERHASSSSSSSAASSSSSKQQAEPGPPPPEYGYQKNNEGRTPLIAAASNSHEAVLQLLLDAGADKAATDPVVSVSNPEPEPPADMNSLSDELMVVFSHARFKSLLCLKCVNHRFANLARRTITSSSRWATARQVRQMFRAPEISRYGPRLAAMRDYLTDRMLSIDDVDTMEAMLNVREGTAFFFVDRNVVFMRQGIEILSPPLNFAHSRAMVELLLEHRAQLNRRRNNDMTPLMDACAAGEAEVVRALCDAGANVHLRNDTDRDLLQQEREGGPAPTALRYAEIRHEGPRMAAYHVMAARYQGPGSVVMHSMVTFTPEDGFYGVQLPAALKDGYDEMSITKKGLARYNPAECVLRLLAGADIHSLGEDELTCVFGQARFASLRALKCVNHRYANLARRTLTSSPRWATARQLCERFGHVSAPSVRDYLTDRILSIDDVDTMEAMLEIGRIPIHSHLLQGPIEFGDGGVNAIDAGRKATFARHEYSLFESPLLNFAHSRAMVELLLEYNADVHLNDQRQNGKTALMDACEAGEAEVVRALCEAGANVHLRDSDQGITALRYAEKSGNLPLTSRTMSRTYMVTGRFQDPRRRREINYTPRDGLHGIHLPDSLQYDMNTLVQKALHKFDVAECLKILKEFGASEGRFRREEWFESEGGLEALPSEYVPAFH